MSHEDDYVSVDTLIAEQKSETREIIDALIADGSDASVLYEIEHHLLSEDFQVLEKAAMEAFKHGFELQEAEQLEEEDGSIMWACDAIMQSALDATLIDQQTEILIHLAEKHDIIYDGWGTYYEGDDAIDYDTPE